MTTQVNIQDLKDNRTFQKGLIQKGIILDYLKTLHEPVNDIAIAAELDLNTALVRQEINSLIDRGLLQVIQLPLRVEAPSLAYKVKRS